MCRKEEAYLPFRFRVAENKSAPFAARGLFVVMAWDSRANAFETDPHPDRLFHKAL